MGNFNNENLIPFTGELKPGQRLLKRPNGYFLPVGVSGGSNAVAGYFADLDGNGLKFYPIGSNNGESVNQIMIADTGENEPEYESGNSIEFYKCASIDTTNQTWTGYKAILNQVTGTWGYASTVTSNLTWTNIKPAIGGIYSADVTVLVSYLSSGIPTEGLVFHAPLSSNASVAVTGQSLTYAGGCTFQIYKGIQSMRVQNGCITTDTIAASGFDNGFTLSVWFLCDNFSSTNGVIVHMGTWGGVSNWWGVQTNNYKSQLYYQSMISAGTDGNLHNDTWYHLIYQQYGGNAKAWINGVADLDRAATTTQCSGLTMNIGNINGSTSSASFKGYIAGVRLYNRVLTSSEIDLLAAEFAPTQS